jgi:diguanylate cyclase (GGDEF)-like protein/PAS domain S-box-containing protein
MAWNILYVIGLSPVKRHDISPALLSLVGVTVTWGLFRFRTFDILPVAQDAVLNSLQDGVIVLNTQGQIAAINPAAQRVFEWPATSVIGRTAVEVFSPWPEIVQWIHNRREAQIEFTLSPAAGASRHYDLALSPLFDSFKRPIGQLILLHDITERKTVEETLRSLSQTDSLTGLANRRRFFDVLKNEVNRARRYGLPLSVIIIDIDDMKSINDTCGHQEGDDALRKIGDHIRPMRQSDQAARIGGDEFALLLPSTDKDGAGRLAWRLYETAQPIRTECGIAVSISLGIAGLELGDDFEGESMLARADQAMYRAKHGRLGCVVDGNSG